jgi:hypothetical protein
MMKAGSDQRKKERFFHGVCTFPAGLLRYEGQDRLVGVFDTPMDTRRHHADIAARPVDRAARDV